MNKIFKYITYALAGIALFVACDSNKPPVFDDANAFVAFDKTAVSIAEAIVKPSGEIVENTAIIDIPVSLASVKGIEESIKFEIIQDEFTYKETKDAVDIDKTAHSGVNFECLSTSGTLSFNAEKRTQNIQIKAIYLPDYTGDLKFDIVLKAGATVGLGAASKCTVTISDVNHPLTPILGEYSCTSTHEKQQNAPWTMTFYKDETDDHMIWIDNIFANPGWAAADTRFYGNVNDDMTEIIIPHGQESEYVYSNGNPVTLCWLNADGEGNTDGSATVKILTDDNGKVIGLEFDEDYGFMGYIMEAGSVGAAYPRISATKK